jgi:hypothetical protein
MVRPVAGRLPCAVTDVPRPAEPPRARALLLAAGLPLLGHALSFGAAVFAARVVSPSGGGGFEDLGATVAAFLVVQVLLAVACIGSAVYYLARNDRPMGLTVAASWLAGAFVVAIVIGSRST